LLPFLRAFRDFCLSEGIGPTHIFHCGIIIGSSGRGTSGPWGASSVVRKELWIALGYTPPFIGFSLIRGALKNCTKRDGGEWIGRILAIEITGCSADSLGGDGCSPAFIFWTFRSGEPVHGSCIFALTLVLAGVLSNHASPILERAGVLAFAGTSNPFIIGS